jgi:hypothetical protein
MDMYAAEPTTVELAAATGFTRAQLDSLLALQTQWSTVQEAAGTYSRFHVHATHGRLTYSLVVCGARGSRVSFRA